MKIPLIGFGTWELRGRACLEAVRIALDVGYRHFDTALYYENHKEVGKALQGVDREKIYVTSKFKIESIDDNDIFRSVEELCDLALKELNTEYVDLFLIHWPDHTRPMEAILEATWRLVEKGKIRTPGVSNYTIHHLQDAYDAGLKVPFNQVEFHPYLYQKDLLEFGRQHGTEIIAFRSLGKGQLLLDEPLFTEIGKAHGKTAAQVLLRWTIQKNIPIIPKASSRERISENFTIMDYTLSPNEVEKIDQLNKDFRYCGAEDNEYNY